MFDPYIVNYWGYCGFNVSVIMELSYMQADKSAYQKIIFLISQPKHMLWVLKRTVSSRRFFWAPKAYVQIDDR